MQLRFANCRMDTGTREVFRADARVHLSPKAFRLLELLVASRPNAISKETIHRGLWPGSFVADGNLANLVSELREGLGDTARQPRIIRTVHRFGYAFCAEAGPSRAKVGMPVFLLSWGEREIVLDPGENLLGRDPLSAACIVVESVSRHHARIIVSDDGALLEDLGSKNGTYLRGKKLRGSAPLQDGDAIRLGSVPLTFHRFDSGTTATGPSGGSARLK